MICRNIQFFEVVQVILYFRTLYDFISHSDKDSLYFFQCNGVRVTVTDYIFLCRQCHVDHFRFQTFLADRAFHLCLSFL